MFLALSSAAATGPRETTAHRPDAPWEADVYDIYEKESQPAKIAEQLCSLLPGLPPEGQAEAARHLIAVLDETNYQLTINLWLEPQVGQGARAVLLEDLGQRPHEVSGPFWAAIAALPSHPLHATALAHGTDLEATFSKPADPK